MRKIIGTLFLFIICFNCRSKKEYNKELLENTDLIHESMHKLTQVMVHDIFSPPVASRIYAYPSIAAYETIIHGNSDYNSLAGQLNGLKDCPKPIENVEYNYEVAALTAFIDVAKEMIFSKKRIIEYETELNDKINQSGIPLDVLNRSQDFGNAVALHILDWRDTDNYKETRTYAIQPISTKQEAWKPTPPDYMPGIEPHWNKIRPFVLDSAKQFIPLPHTSFSLERDSEFYKEMMEVYNVGLNLNEEEQAIAQFWDCNPFVSHHQGHVMFGTKKITPGGHWIGITAIATKQANFNFIQTLETYATVSIGISDAFISCWDEKWRSNLIRPETVINEHVDENWLPLLQTPPFPEHTSGHSVVSASAATILTKIVGDNFKFVDTSEVEYGLPERTFNSFIEASEEAAISRLYGGIHYMPAITNGVSQGKKVGQLVLDKINTL